MTVDIDVVGRWFARGVFCDDSDLIAASFAFHQGLHSREEAIYVGTSPNRSQDPSARRSLVLKKWPASRTAYAGLLERN
jgi:hypothetical protein